MKQFLKSLTIASATAIAIFAACSPAKAVLVNWSLDGVTYDDGGTASGSFQYDADTQQLGNFDISVNDGSIFSSLDYQFSGFISASNVTDLSLPNFSNRWFRLAFDSPLTNLGGNIDISLGNNSSEATCSNANCSIATFPARLVTAGRVVGTPVTEAVPEPLTIMGTILAGGMGIAMKKKLAKKNVKSA